jgi:hypothetical protein
VGIVKGVGLEKVAGGGSKQLDAKGGVGIACGCFARFELPIVKPGRGVLRMVVDDP